MPPTLASEPGQNIVAAVRPWRCTVFQIGSPPQPRHEGALHEAKDGPEQERQDEGGRQRPAEAHVDHRR